MNNEEIKKVVEAILFVSEKPIPLAEMKTVMEHAQLTEIQQAITELKNEYQGLNRSFEISEVAGGYQLMTRPEYGVWIKKLYKSQFTEKLSGPALETLAIIAYKQPLTRAEMEAIRGVNVDGVIKTLLERDLIRIAGRKDVIGHPILYGTTKRFLEYFGLNSLQALPSLKEFTEQDVSEEQIQQRMAKNLYQKQVPQVDEMQNDIEYQPKQEVEDGTQQSAQES